jgi:hypothetical protein
MIRSFALLVSLLCSQSAFAAGLCSTTILARISELQARAEATQSRGLFSALQTRIRIAKSAGIDVSGLDPSSALVQLKQDSHVETENEKSARETTQLRAWTQHSWSVTNVAHQSYSPNGELIALIRFSPHVLEVRKASDGALVSTIPISIEQYMGGNLKFITNDIVAIPDQTQNGGGVTLYEIYNPLVPIVFESGTARRTVLMSGDGKRALLMAERFWDFVEFPSGNPIGRTTFPAPYNAVTDFVGNRIAYSDRGVVRVYDLALDREFSIEKEADSFPFALSPDGKYVLLTGQTLSLWSVDTGKWIRDFDTDGAAIRTVHFANHGQTIVALDKAGHGEPTWIRFIDFESGDTFDMAPRAAIAYETILSEDGSKVVFHGDDHRYHYLEVAEEAQP